MQLILETLVNIKEETSLILKTVVLLDQKYGINYVIRILKGSDSFGFKDERHRQLETFALMKGKHSERIRNLINYLLRNHFLQVNNSNYGSLGITTKGEEFLFYPGDLILNARELRTSTYDKRLLLGLKQLRNTLAREEEKAPFRIYTDYTLGRIVDDKPKDLVELKMIPGLGDYKANRFGPAILAIIQEVMDQKRIDDKAKFLKKVFSGAHQEVKALFEAGSSIEEIAAKRSVQAQTVETYLGNLHKAGEINLKPWIEERLNMQTLEKASRYFLKSPESSLKKAYFDLGIDYDSLKLCRLYVAKVIRGEDEIRLAS
ncbi:MAG: RQC domain-containing protein [Bacteroidota bacterium]